LVTIGIASVLGYRILIAETFCKPPSRRVKCHHQFSNEEKKGRNKEKEKKGFRV